MLRRNRFALLCALVLIFSMVLTACGGETPTPGAGAAATDTPSTGGAAATDTPSTGAAATDTPASSSAMTPTEATTAGETPTTGAMTGTTSFDPSKVKKLDVEPGATLRVTGWSST